MRSVIIMKIEIIEKLEKGIRDNGPSILTVLGVVGLVSTVGLAIKATRDFDKEENKTKEEKVKSVVKHYWPVVVMGAGSIACIIGSNKMNMKRNLALAGALKLSENKITEVKDRWFGEKKEQNDEKCKTSTIIFGDGDIECCDELSGRHFMSNVLALNEAISKVNGMLYFGEHPDLNDFYDNLDLEMVDIYEDMKWDPDNGPIELVLGSKLNEKSKPILTVDFDRRPSNEKIY